MEKIQVLLVGSTGTVGTHIANGLLQSPTISLSLLIRESSLQSNNEKSQLIQSFQSKGAKLYNGDIITDSLEDIQKILKDSQSKVVISCLADSQVPVGQARLIEAVIATPTVEWFFPSEWGWDYEVIGLGCPMAEFEDAKILQRGKLDEVTKVRNNFSYTILCPGVYTDFYFDPFGGVLLKERKILCRGSKDTRVSLTSLENTGKIVAYMLTRGLTDDVKNKVVYFADETVSYLETKERLEKFYKCEWQLEVIPMDELERNMKLYKPDKSKYTDYVNAGFGFMLAQQIGSVWNDNELWNKKYYPGPITTIEEFVSLIDPTK